MDFDQAIQAHASWKMKLSQYLRNPNGTLIASEIARDDGCPLGCWIHKDGLKYTSNAEFNELKREHARFHRAAAAIVQKADRGENVSADIALGGRSEFGTASGAVVSAIMAMKRKLAA